MAREDVHLSDAGLALGLSLGGGGASSDAARRSPTGSTRQRRASPPCPLEPSLTLSLPDEATPATALSVKRERAEEAEAERASSTARGAGAEDDDDGTTRKKLRLTKEQSALLEDRFKEHSTLNPKQKAALAKQLNLRPRQVEVWFQNRRARTKLKQTEVDCEFLKRCCETLTEENRRLQRELQELRALKLAAPAGAPPSPAVPFYMQLPAATLSVCPSCDRLGGPAAAKAADVDRPMGRTATHHFFNPFARSAAC